MKKEHKIPVIRVIRRAVQAAAFVLAPGLFIMVFSALKQVYTALMGGTFSFAALSSQLLLLLAVIPITALMGRFFCGFLCAFGTMGDFFWFLSPKWLKRKVKISEKTDRVLKGLKYFLLAAIVVFVWTFSLISLPATANPWTIFGMYSTVSGWSSTAYLLSLGGALLLLIILGSMLVERFFCRYLCPLGAVFVPLSRIRAFRIKKPKKDCGAANSAPETAPWGYRCTGWIPLPRASVSTALPVSKPARAAT
jgi:polyferredoxin